jgi:hypothetical protein
LTDSKRFDEEEVPEEEGPAEEDERVEEEEEVVVGQEYDILGGVELNRANIDKPQDVAAYMRKFVEAKKSQPVRRRRPITLH